MQSTLIQEQYAAARIADFREEACKAELQHEARVARRGARRFRLALPWR
jgi:hypothetical protein